MKKAKIKEVSSVLWKSNRFRKTKILLVSMFLMAPIYLSAASTVTPDKILGYAKYLIVGVISLACLIAVGVSIPMFKDDVHKAKLTMLSGFLGLVGCAVVLYLIGKIFNTELAIQTTI